MYTKNIGSFLTENPETILGHLARYQNGDLTSLQSNAWLQQIEILQRSLINVEGTICFEFHIPRIGKRIDNVLLIGNRVVVLEFKVHACNYERAAIAQVEDYALDLRNFHEGSHEIAISPILVATEAPPYKNEPAKRRDNVCSTLRANRDTLAEVIQACTEGDPGDDLDHQAWIKAPYRPTPTIVDAARALYRGHNVTAITRHEAGVSNLDATTITLKSIINSTRTNGKKAICFVTGVPGSGKTLAGLNLVCQSELDDLQKSAVFLSGNGPLVDVLREALARDQVTREPVTKGEALRRVRAFIQNIHHFRDDHLPQKNEGCPVEHVVVFDEAQRAWDQTQTSNFMIRKRGQEGFHQSEPAFLISVMDRHPTWAVIVCLIGGGQEINTGEAGLEEWLRTLHEYFPDWLVHLPDENKILDYLPTFRLENLKERLVIEPSLHLGVSLRSFRAEHLSKGIAALMSGDANRARTELIVIRDSFPIAITRSLVSAKQWVRERALGSERFGLLASSGAKRIKPLGVTVDVTIEPCNWFLNDAMDVRSSFYLEDVANEFDVQGLELDWTVIIWDGDLIHQKDGWRYRNFRGTRWQEIRNISDQRYRLNAYRVLLTRARQGMVIVVPEGDSHDSTRDPAFYNPTWEYLRNIGLQVID